MSGISNAIVDYPDLWDYTRELYQYPGVAPTIDFTHIKPHYYGSHASINPTRIVPRGPELDFLAPHGREFLSTPPHLIEPVNKVVRTSRQMLNEIGREPTREEVADKLSMPLEKVPSRVNPRGKCAWKRYKGPGPYRQARRR
jgi:Sigma-70 region 3